MASIYDLKPQFQALLRPCVAWLARAGVTANQITIGAAVISLAGGLMIAGTPSRRVLLLLPIVLFVRMALNAIDGMLAREHQQSSRLGALLNELGDVISDAGLYLPLALRPEFAAVGIVLFVIVAALTELAGVLGPTVGGSRRYDGPMGKSDRALVVGALGLMLGSGFPAGRWVDALIAICVVLAGWTVWRRCQAALSSGASS
jgi:CDP-diacylglycerol---glycerol-3-phosphate 3-phosphatidyltransferase